VFCAVFCVFCAVLCVVAASGAVAFSNFLVGVAESVVLSSVLTACVVACEPVLILSKLVTLVKSRRVGCCRYPFVCVYCGCTHLEMRAKGRG
jgi:hypothetical protein